MREIKFRAFVEDSKTMQKVLMIWLNGQNYGLQFTDGDTTTLSTTAAKEGVKLMQYTGLKDKNDKEIYEGDIVKYLLPHPEPENYEEYTEEVNYVDGCFCVEGYTPLYATTDWNVEVIGNIYENPELLVKG